MTTQRTGLAAILGGILLLPAAGMPVAEAARGEVEAAHIGSVAVLPFVSRGTEPETWPRVRDALRRALALRRVTLVPERAVEEELRRMRLRDTSILLHEEMERLAEALGAEKLLAGYVYRVSEEFMAVTISGRLIDPARRRIEAMVFAAQEGRELEGALGSGKPATLERTLAAAAYSFVDALIESATDPSAGRRPDLLDRSILAPDPSAFFSESLKTLRIEKILVLPFRSRVPHAGAGQAASDLVSWGLVRSEAVSVVEAGDSTRRLLERGWRTGMPVGTEEILSLGLDPGVDAVLMGSVEKWIEQAPRSSRAPEIGLSARLLDARTGRILWAADHERKGDETRVIYEIGNVRLTEELLARASYEMIAPLLNVMEKTARKGARGDTE